MNVHVIPSVNGRTVEYPKGIVPVIDVLRATSTIVTAFYHGCRAVVPVTSVEAAQKEVKKYPRDSVLLCGERGGRKIDGFDLGNSPLAYQRKRVENKTLILTTTNGTRALAQCGKAGSTWITCLLNLGAVAAEILKTTGDVTILCAGQEGGESYEDSLCAGLLVDRLQQHAPLTLSETAQRVKTLAQAADGPTFSASPHAAHLKNIGFGDDLEFCARLDQFHIVPVYENGTIYNHHVF